MSNNYWIRLCIDSTRRYRDQQWAENAGMELDALEAQGRKVERLREELQLARSHIVRTCQALGEWCDETDAEALKRLDAALAGKPSGVILK